MYKDTFEDYLKTVHAEDYHGTDDDMPDAYDAWLGELSADDFIKYADEAIALVKQGKRLDGISF
jgi:hypothetical protein